MECSSEYVSIDGSVWSEASWGQNVSVTIRKLKCSDGDSSSLAMTVEHLLTEMDQLRYSPIILPRSDDRVQICM